MRCFQCMTGKNKKGCSSHMCETVLSVSATSYASCAPMLAAIETETSEPESRICRPWVIMSPILTTGKRVGPASGRAEAGLQCFVGVLATCTELACVGRTSTMLPRTLSTNMKPR